MVIARNTDEHVSQALFLATLLHLDGRCACAGLRGSDHCLLHVYATAASEEFRQHVKNRCTCEPKLPAPAQVMPHVRAARKMVADRLADNTDYYARMVAGLL